MKIPWEISVPKLALTMHLDGVYVYVHTKRKSQNVLQCGIWGGGGGSYDCIT
jgi:hypothetical protein